MGYSASFLDGKRSAFDAVLTERATFGDVGADALRFWSERQDDGLFGVSADSIRSIDDEPGCACSRPTSYGTEVRIRTRRGCGMCPEAGVAEDHCTNGLSFFRTLPVELRFPLATVFRNRLLIAYCCSASSDLRRPW